MSKVEDFIRQREQEIRQLESSPRASKEIQEELEDLREELLEDFGLSPNKADKEVEKVRQNFGAFLFASTAIEKLKNVPFTLTVNRRSFSKAKLAETQLAGNKVELSVKEENEARVKKTLDQVKNDLKAGMQNRQQEILMENVDILLEELSEASKYRRTYVKPKQTRVDSYLGGLSLKKQANRENIYDYWESVYLDPRDNKLKTAIEKVAKSVEKLNKFVEKDETPEAEEVSEDLKEFLPKIEESATGSIYYVDKFDSVAINREDPLVVLKNYIVKLASAYGVNEEYNRIMSGNILSTKTRFFEELPASRPRIDPTSKTVPDRDKTLATQSEDDFDDRVIGEFTGTKYADPLLAYYYYRDNVAAFTEEAYRELSDKLNDAIDNAASLMDGQDILLLSPTIKKEIEQASDSFTDSRETYYLPLTVLEDSTFKNIEGYQDMGQKYNPEKIEEFLLTVGELLWEIQPIFPARSPKGAMSTTYQAGEFVGRISGKVKDSIRQDLRELLEIIDEYYITPSYSGRLTVGEVDFTKSRGAKLIASGSSRLGVQNITGQAYSRLLDKTFIIPPRAIDNIYKFLYEVTTGGGNLDRSLIQKGEIAANSLNEIFAGTTDSSIIAERNNNHIAAIIAYLFEESGKATGNAEVDAKIDKLNDKVEKLKRRVKSNDLRLAQFEKEKNKILAQKDKILDAYKEEILGERNFKGKSLVEREADYRREYQEGKAFPLFALPSFIKMYEKDIARSPRTSKSLGRLRSLLSEIEDLPVVMKSLLKAHDVIRIMRNENIVLGYRPRNIIHYDEVIEKLYVEQKVDLSHSEVEKIVREVNSFSDIAKSMGISEEVVYQVKAQFR